MGQLSHGTWPARDDDHGLPGQSRLQVAQDAVLGFAAAVLRDVAKGAAELIERPLADVAAGDFDDAELTSNMRVRSVCRVVLPQPERPTMPSTVPGAMVRLRLLSAGSERRG